MNTLFLAPQIYVIATECDSYIKIGTAENPDARLAALQTGCPLVLYIVATSVGGRRKERELHSRFAEYRLHGEWFLNEGELREFVDGLRG